MGRLDAIKFLYAKRLLKTLEKYDVIVVCETVTFSHEVELIALLRGLGKPLFMYEVFFLGGCEYWLSRLPSESLNQFDEYLVVSGIHDSQPMMSEKAHVVGADISPICEFSPRRRFTVLMDFPRQGYEDERAVQESALRRLNIDPICLDGEYTFDQIEKTYRSVDLYFVAFPEAFGVPITQLQNYGCQIAAPSPRWVKRHALIPDGSVYADKDGHKFNDNFLIYEDEEGLIQGLKRARMASPLAVKTRFLSDYPHYASGRLDVLWDVLRSYMV